jgi:alpha-beta hydrolase superfamily lysophospholipase
LTANIKYSKLDSTLGTVILLHGIRTNKESFSSLSKKLNSEGFNTVALDSRAHGQSEGQFCTFGVKEKYDVSKLIDYLNSEENIGSNIGLWGQSLGGAIGIQALSIDKRLKFGIIESTFSDFQTITHEYFNYHLGFDFKILTDYLIYRAGIISDFNPDKAKPSSYCKNVNQPILLVHGNLDKRINIKYAKVNFDKIQSSNKSFIEIKGANHLNVWEIGDSAYFDKTIKFLKNTSNINLNLNN